MEAELKRSTSDIRGGRYQSEQPEYQWFTAFGAPSVPYHHVDTDCSMRRRVLGDHVDSIRPDVADYHDCRGIRRLSDQPVLCGRQLKG